MTEQLKIWNRLKQFQPEILVLVSTAEMKTQNWSLLQGSVQQKAIHPDVPEYCTQVLTKLQHIQCLME